MPDDLINTCFKPVRRLCPTLLVSTIACALFCVLAAPALAAGARAGAQARSADVQGVVSLVVDGDSLWFMPDATSAAAGSPASRAPVEVRLARMDAPELCQSHGAEAKAALAALVLHKPARLHRLARDVYGRVVADLNVDGVDVATRMVEEGQAWSARQRNDRGPLMKQERMARALGRGLHAAGGAVLPRDFRRSHGPCGAHAADAPR